MPLTGVESLPFRSRSTPRQRCHHKNLTDPLKLSDACCQNCASWTDTSAALPRGGTKRLSVLGFTSYSCDLAKRSQSFSIYPMACQMADSRLVRCGNTNDGGLGWR